MSRDQRKELLHAVFDNNLQKVKEMVGRYGLAHSSLANGYVLLRTAIKDGYTDIAKYLLTMGCNVNSKNSKANPTDTPLHLVISKNQNTELVEILLNKGAIVDAVDGNGVTPLYFAVCNSNDEIVSILLSRGAYIHKVNCGMTYLHVATNNMNPNVKIVELLLNYGASVNALTSSSRFNKNYAPLHFAVGKGNEETVKLLLSKGAEVNLKGYNGETPLHVSAAKGHLQIVECLVNHGALVNCFTLPSYNSSDMFNLSFSHISLERGNVCSVSCCTPLHLAALNGKDTVVKFLLEHGADVAAQDKDGKTALLVAVRYSHSAVVELILPYHTVINNTGNKNVLVDAVLFSKSDSKIVQRLLDYGYLIDANEVSNTELLIAAVEKGYLKIVESLINFGANVNTNVKTQSHRWSGSSLLHIAVKNQDVEICKLLLNNNADANLKDNGNKCPIYYAIENGDSSIFKLLLSYGAYIKDTSNIIDAFNKAIQKGSLEIVQLILQHDESFDVNVVDRSGRTPLYYCTAKDHCYSRDNAEMKLNYDANKGAIAKILLERGSHVNIDTKSAHYSALIESATNGFKKVVETLIEYNVDVNVVNETGECALYCAADNGHIEIVEILLKSGCDTNITSDNHHPLHLFHDHQTNSPLHIATKNKFLKIVELLLNYGSDFMLKNYSDRTALQIACEEKCEEVTELLLEFVSTVSNNSSKFNTTLTDFINFQGKWHLTSLMIAAGNGCENIVEILLNFGADPNLINDQGRTALHIACESGHLSVIKILLKFGSDINVITKKGLTPLSCVKEGGQKYCNVYMFDSDSDCDINGGYFDPSRGVNPFEAVEEILRNHLIKLKVANLYLCDENLTEICSQALVSDIGEKEEWKDSDCFLFHKDCVDELNIMKLHNIVNDISYYDIVTKKFNELAVYVRNCVLVKSLNSYEYDKLFPIYSDVICSRFKLATIRNDLLETCGKLLHSDISSDISRLPFICIEKILSNLSNDDLKVLVKACSPK